MIGIHCKRMMRCILVFVCATSIATSGGYAQVESFRVNEDNSVTISYYDKNAKEVVLKGTFYDKGIKFKTPAGTFGKVGKVKMQNVGNGYWTYTSEPLASELYWYNFIINDDSVTIDTRNPNVVRDINVFYNYFIIGGGLADRYMDVKPNGGRLQYVWYPSSMEGMKRRRMAVYTPYGYESSGSERFPVLYLLHGSGGDETAWAECGRLVQIMDNMIGSGICKPMIVVMPNGNVELAAAPGEDPENPNVLPSGKNVSSMFGRIERCFVSDVVNYIDANYRTVPDKTHRAIAGLSLGGLHTLYISLNNPKMFDYIGLFSAQTTNALNNKSIGGIRDFGKSWSDLKRQLPFIGGGGLDRKITAVTGDGGVNPDVEIYEHFDEKLKVLKESNPALFYIAVGIDDFTKKMNDKLRKKLDKTGFRYTYNETDGGHTWNNWRKYAMDFLPELFK